MRHNLKFFDKLFEQLQFFEIVRKKPESSELRMKIFRVEFHFVVFEVVFDEFPGIFLEVDDAVDKGEGIQEDTVFEEIVVGSCFEGFSDLFEHCAEGG
jgi:hypothetical protein